MARLIVLAALVAAATAFPSGTFIRIDRYTTNAACAAASTTPTSQSYYALDTCTVNSVSNGGSSVKYALAADNTNVVQQWQFTGTTCAGTLSFTPTNTSSNGCPNGNTNRFTALTSSTNIYSVTTFSDTSCNTLASGPSFKMAGCDSGTQITLGSKIEFCGSSSGQGAADCSNADTCISVGHNECVSGDSTSGVSYDWNAASTAAPAVALTAALIAAVVAVTKF